MNEVACLNPSLSGRRAKVSVFVAFLLCSTFDLSGGSAGQRYVVGTRLSSSAGTEKQLHGLNDRTTYGEHVRRTLVGPNVCGLKCCRGWTSGNTALCITAVCMPSCKNGGHCIRPKVCLCPSSHMGLDCARRKSPRSRWIEMMNERKRDPRQIVINSRQGIRYVGSDSQSQAVCTPATCFNGGTCVWGSCVCPKGYEGRKCEKVVVLQLDMNLGLHRATATNRRAGLELCKTLCVHGTCTTASQPKCRCHAGYYGVNCGTSRYNYSQARRITSNHFVSGIKYRDAGVGTMAQRTDARSRGQYSPASRISSSTRCIKGFRNIYGICRDFNECATRRNICENGVCINSRGSYWCRCNSGYFQHRSRKKCLRERSSPRRLSSRLNNVCYLSLDRQGGCTKSTSVVYGLKTACCCAVGFAWGPACEKCPERGTVEYNELCPSGSGYLRTVSYPGSPRRVTARPSSRRYRPGITNVKNHIDITTNLAPTAPTRVRERIKQSTTSAALMTTVSEYSMNILTTKSSQYPPASTTSTSVQGSNNVYGSITRVNDDAVNILLSTKSSQYSRATTTSTTAQESDNVVVPITPVNGDPIDNPPTSGSRDSPTSTTSTSAQESNNVEGSITPVNGDPLDKQSTSSSQYSPASTSSTTAQESNNVSTRSSKYSPTSTTSTTSQESNNVVVPITPVNGDPVVNPSTRGTKYSPGSATSTTVQKSKNLSTTSSQYSPASNTSTTAQESNNVDVSMTTVNGDPVENLTTKTSQDSPAAGAQITAHGLNDVSSVNEDPMDDVTTKPSQSSLHVVSSTPTLDENSHIDVTPGNKSTYPLPVNQTTSLMAAGASPFTSTADHTGTTTPITNDRTPVEDLGDIDDILLEDYDVYGQIELDEDFERIEELDELDDVDQWDIELSTVTKKSFASVGNADSRPQTTVAPTDDSENSTPKTNQVDSANDIALDKDNIKMQEPPSLQANACSPNPCQDVGVCSVAADLTFHCECAQGYSGVTCETIDPACSSDPCLHGSCNDVDVGYVCVCDPGYEGKNCGEDIDECLGDICVGGTCDNKEGSFDCNCPVGYQASGDGRLCEDINECLGNICVGGTCVNKEGSFYCNCPVGYQLSNGGRLCEDINECLENICFGGTCVNKEGSFDCNCPVGFHLSNDGQLCEDINECLDEICVGGTCVNKEGSFDCDCPVGYQLSDDGQACEDVVECNTVDCGKTAMCRNLPGSYECVCSDENNEYDSAAKECVYTLQDYPQEIRKPCYSTSDVCRNPLSQNVTQQECCCTIGRSWGDCGSRQRCPTEKFSADAFKNLCPHGRGLTAGKGVQSDDLNECELFEDGKICRNGTCVNSVGGYKCECYSGFYYNQRLQACDDINECRYRSKCIGGYCINKEGSFQCHCPAGTVFRTMGFISRCSSAQIRERRPGIMRYRGRSRRPRDRIQRGSRGPCYKSKVCPRERYGRYSYKECCCEGGVTWGSRCSRCPERSSDDYKFLCSQPRIFE